MDIHIHIDDRLVAWVRRGLGGWRGPALVAGLVLGAGGVLWATTPATPLHVFTKGTVISSKDVNENFAQLYQAVHDLELAVAPKDCPAGMVPVGDGCVDKYEASVWARKDGAKVNCADLQKAVDAGNIAEYGAFGSGGDDYSLSGQPYWPVLLDTGYFVKKAYACSIKGVTPSRWITWFQAQQACTASGKHLITNGEWQAAVVGTADLGATGGADGSCRTAMYGPPNDPWPAGPRPTGNAAKCVSAYGVEDMIGNVSEWVDLWTQAGRTLRDIDVAKGFTMDLAAHPWPTGFEQDATWNINGEAYTDSTGATTGRVPAAAIRGGSYGNTTDAGAFAIELGDGPSMSNSAIGFRCAARHP